MITNKNIPPYFPERALPSKAVLYQPLQDIDIYVEDEGSEVFYTELLSRLTENKARIATVIPLRGRENVIKRCTKYSEPRPALFLIDGDLHWLAGLTLPSSKYLYIHPCYCVENYLFCEKAMIQVVAENNGMLKEDEVARKLNWTNLRTTLEQHLVPLFVEFAVAFALCSDIKTVAHGIGSVLRDARKGTPPEMDTNKVEAVRREVMAEVICRAGQETYEKTHLVIEKQIKVLTHPLDSVSGKHFLIPIQMFEAGRIGGQKMTRKSFVFRLARHCSLGKLDALKRKILEILGQSNSTQDALTCS